MAEEALVDITPAYWFGRQVSRTYFGLTRCRYEGRENVPAEGPVVIVANHQSFLDIPLIASSLKRHVCFVARDSLANFKPLGWLMRESRVILVKRGTADRAALRAMLAHLEAGDALVVFPEGTRTRDGSVGEFRAGALLVAQKARAPVVPAGIRGLSEPGPETGDFPGRRVSHFGTVRRSTLARRGLWSASERPSRSSPATESTAPSSPSPDPPALTIQNTRERSARGPTPGCAGTPTRTWCPGACFHRLSEKTPLPPLERQRWHSLHAE